MTLKLLNTVLNTNAIWVDIIDNEVRYGTDEYRHSYFKMNLDTFSKLCKEWAFDNCMIREQSMHNKNKNKIIYSINIRFPNSVECFSAYSESDAIIKAIQWIIDTKDINDTI